MVNGGNARALSLSLPSLSDIEVAIMKFANKMGSPGRSGSADASLPAEFRASTGGWSRAVVIIVVRLRDIVRTYDFSIKLRKQSRSVKLNICRRAGRVFGQGLRRAVPPTNIQRS